MAGARPPRRKEAAPGAARETRAPDGLRREAEARVDGMSAAAAAADAA